MITDDISKMNYGENSYNIKPMEDSEISKYNILNIKQQENDAYENGVDVESITDEQYYFTIDNDNKVLETKMPLVPLTIENFENTNDSVSFYYILVVAVMIILIIVIINYIFKQCMSGTSNYDFNSSSSSSSPTYLGTLATSPTLTFNSV